MNFFADDKLCAGVCYSSYSPHKKIMTYRILLAGKQGQVGAELNTMLLRLGELSAFDRETLDLTKPAQIREVIQRTRPQVIVNAAAYTAVDVAQKEAGLARAINTDAPAVMAEEAKKCGALLVHYSTDYVFDGCKNSPYQEDDRTNPINEYGRSKLGGEEAIRESGAAHLILRTAWVYGTRGRNFLLTILRLATEREELRVVNDQFGAPTWCRAIAAGTTDTVEKALQLTRGADWKMCGTYHLTAGGVTTWHDFVVQILEEARTISPGTPWFARATGGKPLVTRRITPITAAEYPTPARRPAYSVLSNLRLQQAFGVILPGWQEQLHCAFVDAPAKATSSDT
jgi:dTDP-4-dehydrorhamnose reductase